MILENRWEKNQFYQRRFKEMHFIYKKMTSTQKEGGLNKNKSAYLHFCSQERTKIKSEKPDIKSTDIVKVMGERWKALTEKDKEQYNALAKIDKERYMSEKQAHLEQNPPVKKGKKKKGKKKGKKAAN